RRAGDKTFFHPENLLREKIPLLFRKGRPPASRDRILPKIYLVRATVATSNSFRLLTSDLCLLCAGFPDARSESQSVTEFFSVSPRATFPNNRPTSCERSRSDRSRGDATRSSRGIFSWRHNNRAGRRTRSGAPDASGVIE